MTHLRTVIVGLMLLGLLLPPPALGQANDSIPLANLSKGRYAIGLSTYGRLSGVKPDLGVDENSWDAYGIGVTGLYYRHERLFWTVGIGFLGTETGLKPGSDIRTIINETTGGYEIVNVGTISSVIKHQYITVPVSINHLLLTRNGTNIYVFGGAVFDWLVREKQEVDATYDGRYDIIRHNGRLESVSITLRGGAGLYQPLFDNFLLMVGPSYGYTFLSEAEEAVPLRQDTGYLLDLKLLYRIPVH